MTVRRTILGPGTLTVDPGQPGARALSEQVTHTKLIPKVKQDDPITVLSGAVVAGDREESWTLKAKMLPDFGETDGVQEWCFTNRGKTLPFEFVPRSDLTKKLTGTLVVEAVEIGGDTGKADEVEFEWTVLTVLIGANVPA